MAVSKYTVNGTQAKGKQARKTLLTYVNTNLEATGPEDATWELQGAGVEESSIEYNTEVETVHDILGVAETTVKYSEPTQEFDPHHIRTGEKLAEILFDIERRGAFEEYSQFMIMVVHGYMKDAQGNKLPAEVHKNCTIEVTSVGGDSYVGQPFSIHYSNDKVLGTVDAGKVSNPTFAPEVGGLPA